MCHLKSTANEITMINVATMTVTGEWFFISRICADGRPIQASLVALFVF
jgi:hypothetical protein